MSGGRRARRKPRPGPPDVATTASDVAAPARRHRLSPRVPLWTRLLILALIPLLLASFTATSAVTARNRTATTAGQVQARAQVLATTSAVITAIQQEENSAVLTGASAAAKSPSAIPKGTDVRVVPSAAEKAATDAAIAAVPRDASDAAFLDEVVPALAKVRGQAVAAGANGYTVLQDYATLSKPATDLIDTETREIEQASGAIPSGDLLFHQTEATRALASLLSLSAVGGAYVTSVLRVPADERAVLQGQLTTLVAEITAQQTEVSRTAPAVLLSSWPRFNSSTVKGWIALLSDVAKASDVATLPINLRTTISTIPTTLQQFSRMLTAAFRQVLTLAAQGRQSARHSAKVMTSLALGLGALTLVLALFIAWGIRRPMRQLAKRALLISEGSLVIGAERGVPEIGVVSDALNEAIQTLGRFEEQAEALGRGEFTHSSLQTTLPGRLGESLSQSVQQVARLQAHLQHEASHDALTAQINRGAGIRMIEEALVRADGVDQRISIIYIALDDFKETNDRHGHRAGDSILTACAERLASQLSEQDRLVRFGGDEFLVVSAPARSPGDTAAYARALLVRMGEPLAIGAVSLRPGASVGVAFSSPGESSADLLARTDKAVHKAKDLGRGRIEVFDEKMRQEFEAQSRMEAAMRTAVATDQFELHYQPVVDTKTGQLKSLEALLRWEMPGEGRVPPDKFIVVAEQSDLILDIDRWVLDTACRQLAAWTDHPVMKSVAIALNISGRHLGRGRLVPDVEKAVATHGIDPKRLVIEITETALISNETEVATELERLRQRGIKISLDDFGTGYTSIRQLGEMPIDTIKIDRSFMLDTAELAAEGGLVALICGVAHRMNLSVVAEGVEEPEQLRALQALGCERTQGWLVCKALPADNLVTWAAGHQASLAAAARRIAGETAASAPDRPNLQAVSGW